MVKEKRNIKEAKPRAAADIAALRRDLLRWYDRHRRALPWRARAGQRAEPYHVWLSEVMLQQTTVAAVAPYYTKFLKQWPNIHALAQARAVEVMREWAGLGYYARARNLHACAKIISQDLGGVFPAEQDELKKLPGIGDYTSAAIRAIAFNKPASVMDGNIERIMARYHAIRKPLPDVKPVLKSLTAELFEGFKNRPGDLAQALMDLGAGVCIPGKPRCALCPVSQNCKAYRQGLQNQLPVKKTKKPKPKKSGMVYWITDAKGRVLIHQRPDKGLLGGMIGFPTCDWEGSAARPLFLKNCRLVKRPALPSIRHMFTHFDLELQWREARAKPGYRPSPGYQWVKPTLLGTIGFPSVFKKAYKAYPQKGIL